MSYTTRMKVLKRNLEEQKDALFHRFVNSPMGVQRYEEALRKLEARHQERCIAAFMAELERSGNNE